MLLTIHTKERMFKKLLNNCKSMDNVSESKILHNNKAVLGLFKQNTNLTWS